MAQTVSPRRIVAGTDGSEHAARALHWAGEQAVLWAAELDVIQAWLPAYPVDPHDLFTDYAPLEHASRNQLAGAVARLRADVPLRTEVREIVVVEHPATALLEAARGADLLVVGSRGRGGFASLLLGSVSQRCVIHGPCPVAVIPTAWSPGGRGRVVVGVDGSESSYQALRWATREAVLREARLEVVNAWTVPEILIPTGTAFLGDAEALERASRSLLERMTDSLDGGPDGKPPELELRSISSLPASALIEAGREADLLVVGARGLGGLRGLLLGSVSQQCAQHAPCPTVVLHEAQQRTGDKT